MLGLTIKSAKAVAIALLSLIAYQVQHWRQLTLLISILGLPFISYHWIIPESPRWLLTQNRLLEAVKVLEDIAKGNGSLLSENMKLQLVSNKEKVKDKDAHLSAKTEGLKDLFSTRQLALITVIQIYSWFVNSAAYYGLTLGAGSLGGGLYVATALSGLVEIPALVLTNILFSYLGRRNTLCLFMIGGGLSCLRIQLLAGTFSYIISSSALVGKLCLTASYAVIYIHSSEIFPTTIRNTAMGLVSVSARVGGIVAPFIVLLGDYYPNLQFTIFGILTLSSGLSNLRLPETMGKKLPDSVSEIVSNMEAEKENF